MASPTLQSLAAEIERLKRATDPQTLRNAMALTYDPNGDSPRIIDSAGRTLDYTPNIQLLGGTTTLDAQHQRVIYTASGAASYEFDDGAGGAAGTHIPFAAQSGPAVDHADLVTATTGTSRGVALFVGEDTATIPPIAVWALSSDSTTDEHSATMQYVANSGTEYGLITVSRSAAGTVDSSTVSTTAAWGGGSTSTLSSAASSSWTGQSSHATGGATSEVIAITPDVATIHLDAKDVTLFPVPRARLTAARDGGGDTSSIDFEARSVASGFASFAGTIGDALFQSTFMRTSADVTDALTSRVERGPFTVTVTALAALGTQATTINNARNGSDYVVMGGPNGAAGSELLQWSWTNSAVNDITINIMNTDAVNALTATLRFYVISTS